MGADARFLRPTDASPPLPSGMAMATTDDGDGDGGDDDDDMPPLVDRPTEAEANPWTNNASARLDFANPIAKHLAAHEAMDEDDVDDNDNDEVEVKSSSLSFISSSFPSPVRSPSSPATSPSYSVSPNIYINYGQAGAGGYSFSHQFPASPPRPRGEATAAAFRQLRDERWEYQQ